MGSLLVTAAYSFVNAFNDRARRLGERELEITEVALLALMAHTALDGDPVPTFWTKRAEICAQLGIRDTEAGRKRVQRALGALAAAGAITTPGKYQRGHTPRYSLIYQGGCSTSTPSDEVWTPGIPLTGAKGDAPRPKYGRPASPGVDAQRPPEEGRGTEEEPFHLESPRAPQWDADLPTPLTPNDAARCPLHPTGTKARCRACGDNRREWETSHSSPTRHRKLDPLRHRVEHGRRICENHPHVPTADGTCRNCEIRAEDLAHLKDSA